MLSVRSLSRRRVILSGAALATSAIVGPRRLLAAADLESKLRFGMVTYLWGKDMTLPELLNQCTVAGIGGVELRTEHAHGVEPTLSKAERRDVRNRFAESPVELVGYGSNCEYHSDDANRVKANIEQTKQYIRLMHDCGGTGVKVKPNGFSKGLSREKCIVQIGESLNEVAAYGEQYGQKIRLEVHGKGTSELPVIREILQTATHPNLFVCWNSNLVDLEGQGLEKNFEMVKSRLGDTVHVRQLDLGDYPYPQLIELLKSAAFQGWILLEAHSNPENKVKAMIQQREVAERLIG
ncbi:sugar phosphate isomerase/epimerase family protein [Novipirellula artificiosorum]|uniref:Xylose isomerase-like TIM barrel n=1 Tax=Novipirellula artificiosorum TaxID=2528016 RepID=A0A5C6DN06_9BACT|nr:sugar phosphate isomerase/epimerase family protein [Novipirellula artificiosorum]TWU37237.1 Xylose isomerase-like TIM barrel [Novipirellula artificiosorum]